MNILLSAQLAGWLLVLLGGVQLAPLAAALYFGEPTTPFLAAGAVALFLGLPIALGVQPDNLKIRPRDGFFIVTGAWLLASLFGIHDWTRTSDLFDVNDPKVNQ